MSFLSEPVLNIVSYVCGGGVVVFGVLSVWYLGYEISDMRRRWAFVFGLCSEPFWFGKSLLSPDCWTGNSTLQPHWWLLLVTLAFTYSWYRGLKAHWNPKSEGREAA